MERADSVPASALGSYSSFVANRHHADRRQRPLRGSRKRSSERRRTCGSGYTRSK